MIVGVNLQTGVAEVDNATACPLQQESRLLRNGKMTETRNRGQRNPPWRGPVKPLSVFCAASMRPLIRVHRPAWTNGMSMAVVLIFFLILLLHPYDEYLVAYAVVLWPLSRVRHLTDIGLSQWYLIPAFAIGVCLIGIDWANLAHSRRVRFGLIYAQATFAFWAVALAGILTNIAKFLIGRARPKFIDTLGTTSFTPFEAGYNFASFPSGHSTTMGAVGAVLALWFPRWRVPIILATMFIAFTRIIARAHYSTDVVAGYSLGFLFTVALARFLAGRRTAFLFDGDRFWPVLRFRDRFWRPRSGFEQEMNRRSELESSSTSASCCNIGQRLSLDQSSRMPFDAGVNGRGIGPSFWG